VLIDNLGNIVVAGRSANEYNLIASFTEDGTINYSMLLNNGTYGGDFIDLLSTSDNGIVALTESNNDGCIHSYKLHLHLHRLAYFVKIDPTGAGCGEWSAFPLELYGTGVRTIGYISINNGNWTISALPTPQRNAFNVAVQYSCSVSMF
jgi:hypothetical protein